MQTRRQFLRSSSAIITLPLLESLAFQRFASAASLPKKIAPKRMIFLGMGFGVTNDAWYPNKDDTGAQYQLPKALQPLMRHKQDITLLQNLEHKHSRDSHSGSTFWLTGADRYAIAGQSFNNTISVDQVAAEQLGRDTRYSSMVLFASDNNGHGPGSISWNKQGKPMLGLPDPMAMYNKLFADHKIPIAKQQALLADKRSALDTVLSDANALKNKLSKADQDKLNEYFQSIRELEVRISKEEQWLHIPKVQPKMTIKKPDISLTGAPEIEMMYDLMIAAMQIDSCRVFSYRMLGNSLLSSIGSNFTAHNISHHSGGQRTKDSILRDEAHATLLAKFIDKLKSTEDIDGSSLYDNTTVTLGSNLRLVHSLNNCPTLITGGGAGFKHGQHRVLKEKTPLCNLWLSTLKGSGINVDNFGDTTGIIEPLFKTTI